MWRALTLASNFFTGLRLTDMETCYKGMTRAIASRIDLQSLRFGMEPEITRSRLKARICEVPVSYRGRSFWRKIGSSSASGSNSRVRRQWSGSRRRD
jgi:hypothetical protein